MSYPRGVLSAHHADGKVGWVLEGGHEHSCTSHVWESREPLVALQALRELLHLGREPDTTAGPALAGIPAGSWGPARCSQSSGEPLGDSPTSTAIGQGLFLPQLSPEAAPSLLATVVLLAQLNMKHKPGWVIARGSKACQPSAKEESRSLPQASLLTSAESGPTLPVIFNLSILLEQQGNQLLHLVLQRQVHLDQRPHEVTEHLQWRRDALGKVQVEGGTQLSTEWSKQATLAQQAHKAASLLSPPSFSGRVFEIPQPIMPLVSVARLSPWVRGQQTQHCS